MINPVSAKATGAPHDGVKRFLHLKNQISHGEWEDCVLVSAVRTEAGSEQVKWGYQLTNAHSSGGDMSPARMFTCGTKISQAMYY